MPSPAWFIAALLTLNALACVACVGQRLWPWAMIYGGATMIQAGCLWLMMSTGVAGK